MLLNVLRDLAGAVLLPVRKKLKTPVPVRELGNATASAPDGEGGPSHAELEQLISLFNSGQHGSLERCASALLDEYPNSAFIWKVYAASLEAQGKDSLQAMYQAVSQSAGDAQAFANLGFAQQRHRLLNDAAASFRQAVALDWDQAHVHDALGRALLDLGLPDEAASSFRSALGIAPQSAISHTNLGVAQCVLGRLDEALASFQRAVEIDPRHSNAFNCLGAALRSKGLFVRAASMFERAIEIDPNNADAHNNLGFTLYQMGRAEDAIALFRKVLEIDGQRIDARNNLLYVLSTANSGPAPDKLAEAKRFGEFVAQKAKRFESWENTPDPDRCLKVGLVSADLRNHAVGHFVYGVLKALANTYRNKLEVTAYSNSVLFDEISEGIKSSCRNWRPVVAISDPDLAEVIHGDRIDILVDLSGHTSGNRLPMFAWKPAPVQVSWLGYWSTTGIREIDYVIADPSMPTESEALQFTEKIWRLPETRLCFAAPAIRLPVNGLPALANGYVTFGCFNRLEKISDEVVAVWSRVLSAVPDSRLYVKATQLNEAQMREWFSERFRAHGIPAYRIILEGDSSRTEYLAAYQRVDMALDPFPFTGGTTSVEGLWMGVPLLTLTGASLLSRQGVGLLMNCDLPQWMAKDASDYVTRAVHHATDLHALASLRQSLRQRVLASPVFDTQRFAGHLEAAFRNMWRIWCGHDVNDAVVGRRD